MVAALFVQGSCLDKISERSEEEANNEGISDFIFVCVCVCMHVYIDSDSNWYLYDGLTWHEDESTGNDLLGKSREC